MFLALFHSTRPRTLFLGTRPLTSALSAQCRVAAAAGRVRGYAAVAEKRRETFPENERESDEERDIRIREMLARVDAPATFDVLSQRVALLDVHVPTPYSNLPKRGLGSTFSWTTSNISNYLWNARHMFEMAKLGGLPGMKGSTKAWSTKVFGLGSASPSAYIAGFREFALNQYVTLNEAKARGDKATIGRICAGAFASAARSQISHRANNVTFRWKIHKEMTPTKCVSIRTMGGLDPKQTNRSDTYAHILVKFDTQQSLTVFNKNGKPLNQGDKPNRVIEYLVFEKKFWEDGTWVIRDQLYETV